MVNSICDGIEIDLKKKEKKAKFLVDKEQFIDVEGISMKLKFSKDDYENLYDKKYYDDPDFVSVDEAPEWIKRVVIGDITKEDLDQ